MDFGNVTSSGALRIEKLTDDSYHIWKQKFELVLACREVDIAIFEDSLFQRGSFEYTKWIQCGKMARVIIGLSLSNDA